MPDQLEIRILSLNYISIVPIINFRAHNKLCHLHVEQIGCRQMGPGKVQYVSLDTEEANEE